MREGNIERRREVSAIESDLPPSSEALLPKNCDVPIASKELGACLASVAPWPP